MLVERRVGIGKILLIGIIIQPAFDDSVFEIPVDHMFLRSQQGEQSGQWRPGAQREHMSASASPFREGAATGFFHLMKECRINQLCPIFFTK